MKLSEAILLAATRWPQCYGLSSCVVDGVERVCPWEGAIRVAGLERTDEECRLALLPVSVACPVCACRIVRLWTLVIHLADEHRLPFAAVAGLVRKMGVDVELAPVAEPAHA